jgi:gamma-glutamylcyclotransferase (GGCT)/AIG2-like uncharacterized protein YtfP
MSHTMNIALSMNDVEALKRAARRMGCRVVENAKVQLYSSVEEGTAVYLPGWRYPAVVKDDGSVACDTYNGQWGDEKKLNELTAYYGLEKAKLEAEKQGYSVEEVEENDTIKLRVYCGGE